MTRPELPPIPNIADESTALDAFLDYYRASLIDRAYGLNEQQLQITLAPSTLSIGRLIMHMAYVERIWFCARFAGDDMPEPFASLDWDADNDAEMTLSASMTVEQLHQAFDTAVADSRRHVAAAASPDQLSREPEGKKHDLRWIMIHMIEEYARHVGHADLIRESIDGSTAP